MASTDRLLFIHSLKSVCPSPYLSVQVANPSTSFVSPILPSLLVTSSLNLTMSIQSVYPGIYPYQRQRTEDIYGKGRGLRISMELEAIFGFQLKKLAISRFANHTISKSQREIAFPETQKFANSKCNPTNFA